MRGAAAIVLAAVVTGVVLTAGYIATQKPRLSTMDPGEEPTSGFPQLRFASEHDIGGEPGQNTSFIWVARITSVSREEPFSSYEVELLRNGVVVIARTPLRPGLLGAHGAMDFEFFDDGALCSPTPCPPPFGPDGLLSENDYFRLSWIPWDVDEGQRYTVRVVWAPEGTVVGTIDIHT